MMNWKSNKIKHFIMNQFKLHNKSELYYLDYITVVIICGIVVVVFLVGD